MKSGRTPSRAQKSSMLVTATAVVSPASDSPASRLSPAVPATSSRPIVDLAPTAEQTGVTVASR